MTSTYAVRIWAIMQNANQKRSSYTVRWQVGGQRFRETFATRALAESFRSELVVAQRQGVAFDRTVGLPGPMARLLKARSWYQHALAFVDMKWPRASAKHRKGIAETLATVTPTLLVTDRGAPGDEDIRAALYGWAFNKARREAGEPPEPLASAIRWLEGNTVDMSALMDAALVRKTLDALALLRDGKAASPATVRRKRAVFSSALKYAVELRLLDVHPLSLVSWIAPKSNDEVDRRVVVNSGQAELLLAAVRARTPELEAFFGCMYYAALRPEEALHLRDDEYERPPRPGAWGWLLLTGSTLAVGRGWADDGEAIEDRGLKHRPGTATRPVPVAPDLATLLDRHIEEFGTGPDGKLFVTRRGPGGRYVPTAGQPIPNNAYTTAWRKAREAALTDAQQRSPLAKRPYDLRHACLSTWLNAGVPATQVSAWAGNSVNVLMKVYAKCIDGEDEVARRRIEAALLAGKATPLPTDQREDSPEPASGRHGDDTTSEPDRG